MISIFPGLWVIQKSGFEFSKTDCGVTPQSVLENSKPDFCITHSPGKMLITDKLNNDLAAL